MITYLINIFLIIEPMAKREEEKYIINLGYNIAQVRKQKKMTQKKLAEIIDVEPPNMRRIEAGKTNPTIKTLLKIAWALGVDVKMLVDF